MPIDLLAEQPKDLLADTPVIDRSVISWRQEEPTVWDRIREIFPNDFAAQSQKATNALTYSEMLGIRPSVAYEYHDDISQQIQDKLDTEKILTERKGIKGAISSGWDTSLLGMMLNQQVPPPFESVDYMERWLQGMIAMGTDIPFFIAGYGIGGGTPISGMAGAFGFHSGLRQILVDRYTKGEVKDLRDFTDRVASAAKETVKGQVIGGFTGGAGFMSPVWLQKLAPGAAPSVGWKAMNELATMTAASKLIEGQIPTAKDLFDTASILLALHAGGRGYTAIRSRIPEVRNKLQDIFIETGTHPKEVLRQINNEIPDPRVDIIDVLNKRMAELKKNIPVEEVKEVTKEVAKAEPVAELPSTQVEGKQPTSIKNAIVDLEREARGLPPIERPAIARVTEETVKAKVESGQLDTRAMARKINNLVDIGEPVPALSQEWSDAFAYDKTRIKSELRSIREEIKQTGIVPELEARREVLEEILSSNEKATTAIGTAWSDIGRARQKMWNDDYSVETMIQRAKEDGIEITPKLRKKLEKFSEEIEAKETEILTGQDKVITDNLTKTIKQVQNEEALAQRKQERIYTKTELDVEFDSLVKEFNKTIGGQLNIGIDPVAVKILVELARNRIRSGIVTAEGIVDSIHTALVNAGLEYSKRELRDAISQYGVTKEMSKEEIATKLREAKRQMQLISALEDAKKSIAPARTGLQRDKVSDRVRELQRQVNEAMRETGVRAISPEQQWKSSLDAVKTRLKNSIADIVKRFETGIPEPKKTGIKYDEATTDLKRFRDKIQTVLDFAEGKGKKELSPEQKISMAKSALEKSITEYERRITEEDLKPKKKTGAEVVTPELTRLRGERDLLKDIFKMMQEEAKPKKSAEEVAIESFRKRTEKAITEYGRRITEKDYTTKPRKELPLGERELRLQFELEKVKKEYWNDKLIDQLKNRPLIEKIGAGLGEAITLSKSIRSAYDVSAVGRQGWLYVLAHPVQGFKNIPDMFRALRSEEAMFKIDQSIRQRPNFKLYSKAKLELTERGATLTKMEEQFQSRWAEMVPGVAASNRAYISFLNLARANSFDNLYAATKWKGVVSAEGLQAIGKFVNESTGRGGIKGWENALAGLGKFLWAPKLVLSRFQILTGHAMWKGTPETRIAIAKEYGRILRGLAVIYTLASIWDDVTIETSPLSSDFSKIRIGNRRIDVMAGLSQNTVLMDRVWQEKIKKQTGAVVPISGAVPFGGRTTWSIISDFMRTKLTPVLGAYVDYKVGKDVVGNRVTYYDLPEKLLTPLSFGDIYDSMKEDGVPAGLALSILATFGIGIQIYNPQERNKP